MKARLLRKVRKKIRIVEEKLNKNTKEVFKGESRKYYTIYKKVNEDCWTHWTKLSSHYYKDEALEMCRKYVIIDASILYNRFHKQYQLAPNWAKFIMKALWL